MDSSGNILAVEYFNKSIRKISEDGVVTTVEVNGGKRRKNVIKMFSVFLFELTTYIFK